MKDYGYTSLAIVRKLGSEQSPFVADYVEQVYIAGVTLGIPVYESNKIPDKEESVLFVSLGGDGTMLYTAKLSLRYPNSSVLGINLGNLGFLTEDMRLSDVGKFLVSIVTKRYNEVKADSRVALDVTINGTTHTAMNEVTLFAPLKHFMTTNVAVNSMPLGEYKGNGVVVTTATGSTALGLSAGGAIVSPNANIMQIVPILSHQGNKQPIITAGNDHIVLRVRLDERMNELGVLVDGQPIHHKEYDPSGDNWLDVGVTKHRNPVNIWHPTSWNFFYVMSQKIGM